MQQRRKRPQAQEQDNEHKVKAKEQSGWHKNVRGSTESTKKGHSDTVSSKKTESLNTSTRFTV